MTDFVKVCSITDIKSGNSKKFKVKNNEIALFNVNGKFYAIGAVCSHAGGPLDEGYVENEEVECPWHAARFDLKSGHATNPPASNNVSSYEVKIQDNDVLIKV